MNEIMDEVKELIQIYLYVIMFQFCLIASTVEVVIIQYKSPLLSFSRLSQDFQENLLLFDNDDRHNKKECHSIAVE